MRPSSVTNQFPRSGIREIMEMAAMVPDLIHLEVGDPDFPTPEHVCEAAAKAVASGFTKYTPNAGIPELREVLATKVHTRNGIDTAPERIIVTPGAVTGLYGSIVALVDTGSEVLLGDPSWPNYASMLRLTGAIPVRFPVHAQNNMVPSAADIEPLITERTRAVILNSPGNPTGAITPPEALADLIELARAHDLWVLSDEVYDEMWFDNPPLSIATLDPDGRVVTCFSFSKTYAMTGWRVGYVVAPGAAYDALLKVQEPITSCINAPAQKAAIAAIVGPQDCVGEMRAAYQGRRDEVMRLLDKRGLPYVRPSGAFYILVDISAGGLSDVEFCRRLVKDKGVAVVPGSTFGPNCASFVRVSLATATDQLVEGIARLADAVDELGG
jgi:aspartate aminotransferase